VQHKRVIYVPPSEKEIEAFAREVCDALTQQGKVDFSSKDVRWGMANFLKLLAELTVKQRNDNSGEFIDNADRAG
jgi:hypothetical protein